MLNSIYYILYIIYYIFIIAHAEALFPIEVGKNCKPAGPTEAQQRPGPPQDKLGRQSRPSLVHLSTCGMAEGNKVGDEEEREEDVRAAVGARVRAHHAPGGIVTGLAWHLAVSSGAIPATVTVCCRRRSEERGQKRAG